MYKAVRQLKEKYVLKSDFNPFLNKYHYDPEQYYPGISVNCHFPCNEAVLVLDEGCGYRDYPYILEADRAILEVLLEYFSIRPVHRTNRVSINSFTDRSDPQTRNAVFETLICDHIRPKIMVSFSRNAGTFIEDNFCIEKKQTLSGTDCWKGFLRLADRYFYIYCLPDVCDKGVTEELNRFILSSLVFESQTCQHLNAIIMNEKDFNIPDKPLNDSTVKKYLPCLKDYKFFSLHNIVANTISKIAKKIEAVDEYDFIASIKTKERTVNLSSKQIDLTLDEYIQLRRTESSQSICVRYLDKTTIDYGLAVLELAIIRLYLFLKYPEQSFGFEWDRKLKLINSLQSNYEEDRTIYDTFLQDCRR